MAGCECEEQLIVGLGAELTVCDVDPRNPNRLPKSLAIDSGLAPPPDTVQWSLARSSSKSPERARIKPLTTSTHAGKAITTHMLTSPAISSPNATR